MRNAIVSPLDSNAKSHQDPARCKERRGEPGENRLLAFKAPAFGKLTCCKMEICPNPQGPALRFELFILQTTSNHGLALPQIRGSLQSLRCWRSHPRTSAWVTWEQCYLGKEKA